MNAIILLIEDNAQNLYLTRFLLDVQLPGMDGHAVAQALKADAVLKFIPVVAVTSYAMAGDREKCLAAGAEGYIEKPINPDTFVQEIERYLKPAAGEIRT